MRHKKTKILMLCFAHPVDDGRVTFREAATLRANGYRVAVMGRAGITGKIGGHRVHGVPTLAISNRYSGNMMIRFLLEPFSLIRFFFVCRRFIGKADVIHCHEYQSLLIALLLKRKGQQKIVYDCHEFQPELFAEMFNRSGGIIYRIIRNIFARYEKLLTSRVDGVVTVNDFLVQRFRGICDNVCNLPNYPSKNIFSDSNSGSVADDLQMRLQGRKVLVFAGYLSEDRGVIDLLYIMREIVKIRNDIALLLVGGTSCEDAFLKLIKELQLDDYVTVTGAFKYDELINYLRLADIGVYLPIDESWRLNYSIATKIFQYCAVGLPVVLSDNAAHRYLMTQCEFAILADGKDYCGCARQMVELLDDSERCAKLGRNALNKFCSDWNVEVVEMNLVRFYNEIKQNIESAATVGLNLP